MRVSMVDVREMRVFVSNGGVAVQMIMGFAAIPLKIMRMLVVFVMRMVVDMFEGFMHMFMFVMLGKMQPHAASHQAGGTPECRGSGFAKQSQCHGGADERGDGKIGSGARCSEPAQRKHK